MKYFLLLPYFLFSLAGSGQEESVSATIVQLLKADYATMDDFDMNAHVNNVTRELFSYRTWGSMGYKCGA